jgi:lipopolysaccharide heptosyltransferase II
MPRPCLLPLAACSPQRIGLLKPSALGDIIHTLPVLTALRQRFPTAHITWIINSSYEPLIRGHCDLDDTLPFDRTAARRGYLGAIRGWARFLVELRRRRFDLILDLQGLFRTGLMVLASGASRRVGLSTAREGASWTYTDVIDVPHFDRLHAVERYWLVAEALGAGPRPGPAHVPIADDAHRWAEQTLRGQARPWLMVGPGSRWVTKRWPPEHFATLAQRGQARYGGTVVFVGGRDETPLAATVRQHLHGPSQDFTGQTTLPQLAALLSRADVMLANDTGPLHLAAALGRPVIAPYTCTRVRLNGPYGGERGAVETRVSCAGSYRKHCRHRQCMSELSPDRLWPLLDEVLHAWQMSLRPPA